MAGKDLPALRFLKGGLRRKLLLLGLTLLGAALVINTFAGSYYTRTLIIQNSAELQTELARRVAFEIEEFMEGKLTRLIDFAASVSLQGLGSKQQRLLALLLLKNDQSFKELAILDERGQEVLKVSETRLYLASELSLQNHSEKFKRAIGGKTYVSPVYTSERAEPYVTLSVPIRLSPRQMVGVVSAEANLKSLWDVVRNIQFGKAGYAYLVDAKGNLIAHRDSSLVLKRLNLSGVAEIAEFMRNPKMIDETPAEEGPGITGEAVISTYAPVRELGWAVVLAEPVTLALHAVAKMRGYAVLLLVVGLSAGAFIIAWAGNRITNPIRTLHLGAQLIGAGNLDHRVAIKSGDEIEELADEFNKMALELKNSYSNLEQKVQQRTQEMAVLYEITTAVNRSLDVQAILQAVIARIAEMFHFEAIRIFLFDDEMHQLELQAAFEVTPDAMEGVGGFEIGQGIIGRVGQTGEPLIFDDVCTDPRYAALSLSRTAQTARRHFFAAFPIKTQARAFGAITFTGEAPRKLTADEVRLLTSMTEHLGVAVEKAGLFRQVETRSQHLELLNTIGAAVSQSLYLEVIFQRAVDKIAVGLGFDAAWIYQLEAEERQLHLQAYTGLADEMAQSMAHRGVTIGISGAVMESGQRLVFEDVQSDARYRALTSSGKVVSLGFQAAAAFPIRIKEKIIGTLHVAHRTKRHFTQEELQLIESTAQVIGVALENARLFAEVKKKTFELMTANQELLEATRAKSEFIAAMSHELRTPLNIIIGNADLTRDGFFGELNLEQKDALQKISRSAVVLLKMINDVLTLSRIEAKKMSVDLSTFDVTEIIAHARTHVEQINRDGHLQVVWVIDPSIPPLVSDPIKVEEILQNLIGNAFKFTPAGKIQVQVRNLADQARVEFTVADTGIGIDSADLGRIFNEFEQIKEAHTGNFNGVGLGLSIVKKYLDLLQGDIEVESEPGQGSTFKFSIPQQLSPNSHARAVPVEQATSSSLLTASA